MTPRTRYLSRLLGILLLILVAAAWTQPDLMAVIAPAMLDQPGVLFVSGMLTLVAGLAIILGHNAWRTAADAMISFLGWAMTLKGAALLLVPPSGWVALLGAMHYPSHSVVYTIVPAAAGLYLTYAGFFSRR